MPSEKDLSAFPDVQAKLQKPTKQSAFEKQKAEAEAKRQREAAETAAVYQDFLKSFDRDGDDDDGDDGRNDRQFGGQNAPRPRPGLGGPPSAPGASRRHFGTSGLKSGPGSLGPPPMSFGKKRSFQDFSRGGNRDAHDDREASSLSVPKAFNTSDDEDREATKDRAEEKAIAKPTLRLVNLPPGTSPAAVKALVSEHLTVENVKVQSPSGPSASERKSTVAIVTLSQETPGNEIEAAVSSLQNRYLGYGYYLSLHRHLSSAVTGSSALGSLASSNTASSLPFGAQRVEQPSEPDDRRGQQGFHRGFAPPSSYNQAAGGVGRGGLFHVPVKAPSDIRIIQLINMVIEGVLEHGPEFEALLMSRPEVQREEKWAWIWDARSEGGVWYRWRLWEVITGAQNEKSRGKFVPLFDGSHAWKVPEKKLPFEYTTKLDEIVSDSDYNSSDDEDLDGEAHGEGQTNDNEKAFLSPLEKAKLTHLLARLPTTLSKVRKGDIARVTTFAIMHASRGVEEVVDIIVSNVEKPFSLTAANPNRKQAVAEEAHSGEGTDASGARLVGLYVVSDILSSSSTSGVRHAWRFRQLFEAALRDRKLFERLGMMAEKLGWGRLRAEKWKRSVNLVLNLWEGWCVFPAESQELFAHGFEHPPSLKVEVKAEDSQKKGKWKAVEAAESTEPLPGLKKQVEPGVRAGEDDVEGEPIEEDDVAGEPIEEDDVAGEPIEEDDVAGEPIDEDDIEGEPMDEDMVAEDIAPHTSQPQDKDVAEKGNKGQAGHDGSETLKGGVRKPRMRAVDMFADSDESDGGP